MSLKEIQEDFNKTIKPQLAEMLIMLKNLQLNNNIEVAAAKIINELKTTIQECSCNKKNLDALLKDPSKGKEIIPTDDQIPNFHKGNWKYSYPNFEVGNEELGTSINPNSLSWPIKKN